MKNKGFTLIELLLACAMSSIIALGIGYMMQASSENYAGAQTEVSLQSDAQMIMNNITDYIQQCNNLYYDQADHLLTIYYSINPNDSTYPQVLAWLNTTNKKLYICKITDEEDPLASTFTTSAFRSSDEIEKYLLAEHVDSFECDQQNYNGLQGTNTTVHIKAKMALGDSSYELENTVKVRNRIESNFRSVAEEEEEE